nr:hypothetical protein [Clostridioides difficile]
MDELFHIGIDVGSTTVKVVVLNNSNNIVHKEYRRHYSDVKKSVKEVLNGIYEKLGDINTTIIITGSGGIGISKKIRCKICSGSYI